MKKKFTIDDLTIQLAHKQAEFEFFLKHFSILEGESLESLGIAKQKGERLPLYVQPYRTTYFAYQWAKEGLALCKTLQNTKTLTSISKTPEKRDALARLLHIQGKKRHAYIDNFYSHAQTLTDQDIPTTFDALEPHIKRCSAIAPTSIEKNRQLLTGALLAIPTIDKQLQDITKALPGFKTSLAILAEKSEFFWKCTATYPQYRDVTITTTRGDSSIFSESITTPLILREELSNIHTAQQLLAHKHLHARLEGMKNNYSPTLENPQSKQPLPNPDYGITVSIHNLYDHKSNITSSLSESDLKTYCASPKSPTPLHEVYNIKRLISNITEMTTFLQHFSDITPPPPPTTPLSPSKHQQSSEFHAFQQRMATLKEHAEFFLKYTSPLLKEPDNAEKERSSRVAQLIEIRHYANSLIALANETTTQNRFNTSETAQQQLRSVIEAHTPGSSTYHLQQAISTFYTHKTDIEAAPVTDYIGKKDNRTARHRLYQEPKDSPNNQSIASMAPAKRWLDRHPKQEQAVSSAAPIPNGHVSKLSPRPSIQPTTLPSTSSARQRPQQPDETWEQTVQTNGISSHQTHH